MLAQNAMLRTQKTEKNLPLYTQQFMAVCPLCSQRPAKRFCPAKAEKICPTCCGTKREIEIDCPSHCTYLRSGRDYEAEKRTPDPELASRAHHFQNDVLYRLTSVLDAISREVVVARRQLEWMVDTDVINVYKALTATMKTLASGIYYESIPELPVQQALFRHLKALLDQLMQPQNVEERALKVSEAIEALEFLTLTAQMNSSIRPKSRRYLDWLSEVAADRMPAHESPSGLILP